MKIAIDARFYGLENGGLGRYTINLIEQLQKFDLKNEYVLLLRDPWYKELSLQRNFKKVLIHSRHYSVNEQLEVPIRLRSINPDITHFLHFNVPLFYNKPYIVTIHDLLMHTGVGKEATTLPPLKYHIKRRGYRSVFDHAVSNAQKIIVPSNFVKNEISKIYRQVDNKIEVIYEGVSFLPEAKSKKTKDKYFIYVGNAYPHKNIVGVIQAIFEINKSSKELIHLKLVTPRDIFTKRLNEQIEKLHASDFVKTQSFVSDAELSSLYSHSIGFVYPSFSEGFGLQGLEAMHAKTRLLASDIPVFHEIYADNAYYFNPHSIDEITESFKKLLNESNENREKILLKAKDFTKKYSWRQMARDTLAIYAKA